MLTLRERLGMANGKSPLIDNNTNPVRKDSNDEAEFRKEISDMMIQVKANQDNKASKGSSCKENGDADMEDDDDEVCRPRRR